MESNNKLKEIDVKNIVKDIKVLLFSSHNKNRRFYFDNILINEKSYKNILVYNISYKNLIGTKPFCIRFDKVDVFIRIFDGTRYLALFGGEKNDFIYNRIRYLIELKSSINYAISHYYAKIKVDSHDSLHLEKS